MFGTTGRPILRRGAAFYMKMTDSSGKPAASAFGVPREANPGCQRGLYRTTLLHARARIQLGRAANPGPANSGSAVRVLDKALLRACRAGWQLAGHQGGS